MQYKLATSTYIENVWWVYAPFLCGTWPDIKIFRNKFTLVLLDCEYVVVDNGYQYAKFITRNNVSNSIKGTRT